MRNCTKSIVKFAVGVSAKTSLGRFIYSLIVDHAMNRSEKINHLEVELIISTPNALNQYRADTFSTKEPETLEWIDNISNNSVFWDIGANVGLYACYAAKRLGCEVFAFEPSVFNLELLARNIYANGLTEKVTIVPLPLSNRLAVSKLNMTSTDWGGALSTFGENYGHDGRVLAKIFEFSTIGLSMSDAVDLLNIPQPDYIKMDVDGIEHLILKGGGAVLEGARSLLIEINDDFSLQSEDANKYLIKAGFKLKEKRHAEEFNVGDAMNIYNQIWIKN